MNKETPLAPIIVIALSVVFIIAIILLYFKPGNAKLTRRKLKTGAAIIALTSIVTTQTGCVATCYDPPELEPENEIEFTDNNYTPISMNLSNDTIIEGTVKNRMNSIYPFQLIQGDSTVQSGNLEAVDGAFNDTDEAFNIHINSTLPIGTYYLHIFAGNLDDPNDWLVEKEVQIEGSK